MKHKTIGNTELLQLREKIRQHAIALGFRNCAFSNITLDKHEKHFLNWLQLGRHGEMHYMQAHGTKRSRPAELEPGTCSIISVQMDYLHDDAQRCIELLQHPDMAYISRYAVGRDYHKLMRKRLQQLADKLRQLVGEFSYRVFVDSAPVLEKALAEKAGLGWIGKHSNLLTRKGSWFFIGEIYTDLPLSEPTEQSPQEHCGTCRACIDACPTGAIVAPYQVDARLCISYLTIELKSSIPEALRPAIGNRIYGCDDCQLYCPWNRFTLQSTEKDFTARHQLDKSSLLDLFAWSEEEFLKRMEGSPIRRIGYHRWLRNIAVALGNQPDYQQDTVDSLQQKREQFSNNAQAQMLLEHIDWALQQQQSKQTI